MFGENCDIFVERFRGADVASGDCGVPWGAGRQLALLEDQGQQREQRMAGKEPRFIKGKEKESLVQTKPHKIGLRA